MKKIIIVGAGPCGLFTAYNLLQDSEVMVELHDQKKSPGHKLLVAGKSGLNLTHSQEPKLFCNNYFGKEKVFLEWFQSFDNSDLVDWVQNELGLETFVGSSGRVFPKDFKAAVLLKKIMDHLRKSSRFSFHGESTFSDFNTHSIKLNDQWVDFDSCVFALGGGSWKKTGSDGRWQSVFLEKKININPFIALNCGFTVQWNEDFLEREERLPLKYCRVSFAEESLKGDLMLTEWGIEGSPIYYLSHFIQKREGKREVILDLTPDLTVEKWSELLEGKKSLSSKLKKYLDPTKIRLLKNCLSKDDYLNKDILIQRIKALPIKLDKSRELNEAISTSGGISFQEVTKFLELKKYPNIFIGGEMLDWDAPTGGYLLQGCFTQGFIIAQQIKEAIS